MDHRSHETMLFHIMIFNPFLHYTCADDC